MFFSEYYFVPRDKHDNQTLLNLAEETLLSALAYTHFGGKFTFIESLNIAMV